MRKTKLITLGERCYELRELTINDVFCLSQVFGNVTENVVHRFIRHETLITSISDIPRIKFLELGASEVTKLYEEILQLNSQFFYKREEKESEDKKNSSEFTNELFSICCTLIEAGHKDVFTYGYSFFIRAINNYEKIKNRNIVEVATSVRMAYHSDNKEWKKYVRSLIGFHGRKS